MLTYFHPFYRYLSFSVPDGNTLKLFYKTAGSSNVQEDWRLHAGASNLLAVEFPSSLAVVSAGDWALGGTIVTAGLVVRMLPGGLGPPALVYSATTTPRVLSYTGLYSYPSRTVTATTVPASVPSGAFIVSHVSKLVALPGGDFERVVSTYTYHPAATAGTVWPEPLFTNTLADTNKPAAVFDVRLDSDAFIDAARSALLAGQTEVSLQGQVWAATSQGDTYFSDVFSLSAALPVIREPDFL